MLDADRLQLGQTLSDHIFVHVQEMQQQVQVLLVHLRRVLVQTVQTKLLLKQFFWVLQE